MEFLITKPDNPFVPEFGDFLFGREYISELKEQELVEKEVLPLRMTNSNIWSILIKLGLNTVSMDDFKCAIQYHCPFDNFKYYGMIPTAIISDDISKYRHEGFENGFYDIFWDVEWTKGWILKTPAPDCCCKLNGAAVLKHVAIKNKGEEAYQLPLSNVDLAHLGHGYTYETLPTDGSGGLIQVKIPLDNGDFLGAIAWIWYNK